MNEVLETDTFSQTADSCEKSEREWIDKMRSQLSENLLVGKLLHYEWFREKKFRDKRLFYLINQTTNKAVLIAFGCKQEQEKIIQHFIVNKIEYLKLVE